jgi:two-component system C4-dicarboxylate transport sensor histidine kinase DctB
MRQLVMAERFRLEQVLVNLLQNASRRWKAADPKSRSRSRSSAPRSGSWSSDNGPGVSARGGQDLFTPFATTKLRGLGLGLVISRDIVAEFGGELSLEPPPARRGFVMSLSKAR